jgi:nucleotide-binding universal stress UspA family protein
MTFSTLMVHLDLEPSNDACLQIAGELAEQFDAKLIGIAAANPQPAFYANGSFAQGLVAEERSKIKNRLAEAEERFRTVASKRARQVEWRYAMQSPTPYVAREARSADLIITGASRDGIFIDPLHRLDLSDLVMTVGRPVFVVPPETEFLSLKTVLVAWKDTREARRAVVDALPLLHRAHDVTVLEVIDKNADQDQARHRVDDVAAWLGRHNITTFGQVMHARDEAEQIDKIWQTAADTVVAGAYGHSRFREWMLGGVTRNLLTRSRRCSFLAH